MAEKIELGNFDPNAWPRYDIAKVFGVHPQTVSRWRNAGCPCNPDNTYSSIAVHKWLVKQENDKALEKAATGEGVDSPALERYRIARANIVELDLEVKKDSLISSEEVAVAWAERVAEVAAGLETLVDRLPPIVEGKPRAEIRKVIDDEVWRLRDQYARPGKHCGDEPAELPLEEMEEMEKKIKPKRGRKPKKGKK